MDNNLEQQVKQEAERRYPDVKFGDSRNKRAAFISGFEYAQKEGWVSVEDGEEPYNGQNIICYYNPSDKYKKPYVITLWWSRGKWYYDAEEYNPAEDETLTVTHWLPLPSPPTDKK